MTLTEEYGTEHNRFEREASFCVLCDLPHVLRPGRLPAFADDLDILEFLPTSVTFHPATGLDETAVAPAQTTLRQRILCAFVGQGLLERFAAKEMRATTEWFLGGRGCLQ